MQKKDDAIESIVSLMGQNDITLAEIRESLERRGLAKTRASLLSRLLGYLGGIFIFAGFGVFIAMFWHDMNGLLRVMVTFGSGLILYSFALFAGSQDKLKHAAVPVHLIAAFLQTSGLFVAFDELFNWGGDWHYVSLLIYAAMFVQQVLTFYVKRYSVSLFNSISYISLWFAVAFDLLKVDDDLIAFVIGASLLCISYGLERTKHRSLTGVTYFIGSALLLVGGFELLERTPIEVIYVGLSAGIVWLSTLVHSRVLLFNGTVGMLTYIGYFSNKHFVDSIGWPAALVLFGFALLGLSAGALKLGQKMRLDESAEANQGIKN